MRKRWKRSKSEDIPFEPTVLRIEKLKAEPKSVTDWLDDLGNLHKRYPTPPVELKLAADGFYRWLRDRPGEEMAIHK